MDLSRDIVSIYTSKMTDLAREMEAANYGRGEGGIIALLRAAAKDLDEQNRARGGATGASIVNPHVLLAFASKSPAVHLFKEPQKTAPIAAAAAPAGSSDPLIRFLSGDARGTSLHAAADVSDMTAAAKIEAERFRPAAEDILRRGGMKMPAGGSRLEAAAVDEALTKAGIVDSVARISAKRVLERAQIF